MLTQVAGPDLALRVLDGLADRPHGHDDRVGVLLSADECWAMATLLSVAHAGWTESIAEVRHVDSLRSFHRAREATAEADVHHRDRQVAGLTRGIAKLCERLRNEKRERSRVEAALRSSLPLGTARDREIQRLGKKIDRRNHLLQIIEDIAPDVYERAEQIMLQHLEAEAEQIMLQHLEAETAK